MNLYIFSNIKTNYIIKTIQENDILVFLNTAVEYQKYKNIKCRKIIFHGYLKCKKSYAGQDIKEIQNYYIRGYKDLLTNKDNIQLNKIYDYNYISKDIKGPTTGFIVNYLCNKMFGDYTIKLVNFFPTDDFSTTHDSCHNWKFESEYYKKQKIDIIDTRTKNYE